VNIDDLIGPGTKPEVLGSGYGFTEGPAADARGAVYFSDGRNDSIHYVEPGKAPVLFAGDSTDANGMIFNTRGELIVCEGAAYRVVAVNVTDLKSDCLASPSALPNSTHLCLAGW